MVPNATVEPEASNDVGWPGAAGVATNEATGRWSGVTAMGPLPRGHECCRAVEQAPTAPGGLGAPVTLTVFSEKVVISTVPPSGVANKATARSFGLGRLSVNADPPGREVPKTRGLDKSA